MSKRVQIDQQCLHIQLYGTSPSPSRDYHGLTITSHNVVLNTWRIKHSPYVFPIVRKCEILDYPYETILQTDIIAVFGDHLHKYLLELATGQPSLICIPNKLMLKILRFLSAQDILRLSQTSKIFWELCNTNPVWKIIFNKRRDFPITFAELKRADLIGWKNVLRSKLDNRIYQSLKMHTNFNNNLPCRPFGLTTESIALNTLGENIKPNFKNSVSKLVPISRVTTKLSANINYNSNIKKIKPIILDNKLLSEKKVISKNKYTCKSTSELVMNEKLFDTYDDTTSLLSKSFVVSKQLSPKTYSTNMNKLFKTKYKK